MKTEQAIKLLHRLQDEQFDGIHGDERREALEMAVRALFSQQTVNDSQELVNDCISRQAAIDAVAKWFYDVFGITESDGTATIFKRLRELPPAQPERKRVRWLPDNNCYYETRYICSECKLPFHVDTIMMIPAWRFCPNCGARMDGGKNEIN